MENRSESCGRIILLYLNGSDSELEVNVKQHDIVTLKKKVEIKEYPNDLFDDIERTLVENMQDTFARFLSSLDYLRFVYEQNFSQEI
jgi:hypothetical protein